MENKNKLHTADHPGVYIPPPLFYVVTFFSSIFLQKFFPISKSLFTLTSVKAIGWALIAIHVIFIVAAFARFIISRNTLIPIKPATSLQTTGIYAISRNPMYLALLLFYLGIAVFKGNWWTYLLTPILIFVVQKFVITKEEQYLQRAFSHEFSVYCRKVRRWI